MSPTHNPLSLPLSLPPLPLQASAQIDAYWSRPLSSFDLHPHGYNTSLAALGRQLRRSAKPGARDLFSRANMFGHLTASALVLAPDAHGELHALLVHHKASGLWLVPGGHFERDASLWAAAAREVREETGVTQIKGVPLNQPWQSNFHALPDLQQGLDGDSNPPVFDIDTHSIPDNPAKAEKAHLHHDFLFLAMAESTSALTPQLEEVHNARWEPLRSLATHKNRRMQRVMRKFQRLCDLQAPVRA